MKATSFSRDVAEKEELIAMQRDEIVRLKKENVELKKLVALRKGK